MNNKKMIIALMLCFSIGLTGCGSGSKTKEGSKEAKTKTTADKRVDKDADIQTLALEDEVVQIDGVIYSLYDPVSKLMENGWEPGDADEETVPSHSESIVPVPFTNKDDSTIFIKIGNLSDKKIDFKDGIISDISINGKSCTSKVVFPKGITLGKSNVTELQDTYGGASKFNEGGFSYNSSNKEGDDTYRFTASVEGTIVSGGLECQISRDEKPEDISFDAKKLTKQEPYMLPDGDSNAFGENFYGSAAENISVQAAGVDIKTTTTMKDLAESGISFTLQDSLGSSANAVKGNIQFIVNFKCDSGSETAKQLLQDAIANNQPSGDLTISSISFDSKSLSDSSGETVFLLPGEITDKSTAQEAIDIYGRNYSKLEYKKADIVFRGGNWALQLNYEDNTTLTRCTITPQA